MYLLIKPASGACNLRCKYCFYTDEMRNREHAVRGIMTDDCLCTVIEKALARAESTEGPGGTLSLGFQGGEPTLAGLDFFRRAVSFAGEKKSEGFRINWFLQTNGTLIDEQWAAFLAENHFLCGLSFDGFPELNDKNRRRPDGKGSSRDVLRAASLLRKAGADFNILSVLTGEAARSPAKIYNYLRKNGFAWHQFIPCIAPLGGEDTPWTLDSVRYGSFLRSCFDLWFADVEKGSFVYNREFENWIGILAGILPEECGMRGVCSPQYLIESDGSVYPCDFYALDSFRLGNLTTDSFDDVDARRKELRFIEDSEKLSPECDGCRWLALCRGGCRRNRDENGKNRFCEAYRSFFEYAYPRMEYLAKKIVKNR